MTALSEDAKFDLIHDGHSYRWESSSSGQEVEQALASNCVRDYPEEVTVRSDAEMVVAPYTHCLIPLY